MAALRDHLNAVRPALAAARAGSSTVWCIGSALEIEGIHLIGTDAGTSYALDWLDEHSTSKWQLLRVPKRVAAPVASSDLVPMLWIAEDSFRIGFGSAGQLPHLVGPSIPYEDAGVNG